MNVETVEVNGVIVNKGDEATAAKFSRKLKGELVESDIAGTGEGIQIRPADALPVKKKDK